MIFNILFLISIIITVLTFIRIFLFFKEYKKLNKLGIKYPNSNNFNDIFRKPKTDKLIKKGNKLIVKKCL